MGTVLAVDLAAKHSAAVLMDDNYQVSWQFDSFDKTEEQFIHDVCQQWCRSSAEALILEDLPHGVLYTTVIKKVCRLQGRFVEAVRLYGGDVDDILFLAPAAWRSHYPQAKRGTGSTITVPIAAEFDYQPPTDLSVRTKGKGGKTLADKIATDYCSAYLIARWAIDKRKEHNTYNIPGTSRYTTKEIRKKDFQ